MGRKVKAALFDIGATLVSGPEVSPARQLASTLGLAEEEARRAADLLMTREFSSPREACAALSALFPLTAAQEEAVCRLWAAQETAARPLPGALEAVRRARDLGFAVALVSDIWVPYFRGFLSACPEIAALVDFCALSFQVGRRKPDGKLFRAALQALGAEPSRAVMVGDTYEKDILPALEMGMFAVWVLSRPEKEGEALARVLAGSCPRPQAVVGGAGEVARALEEINRLLKEK
ncbi:HAD family hydrolase [Desulfovirgula thermocuniculi]|uniref:HAD family hydrolase n=1 Tax=Desulfovirgula thermocuniculi TaxID=348842 RepID=UPI00041806D8|nr:HAD family hydrolase [Desulfovirgula thermocuniculi]